MNRRHTPLALSLIIAFAAPLAGCATSRTPLESTVTMTGVRSFLAAESGFDAAVETADIAVRSGRLSVAASVRIRALADTGHAYIMAGRGAVEAANADDLATQTDALTALVAQLVSVSKG